MTLAIILVIAAALGLIIVLRIAVSRSLQISRSSSLSGKIETIDVEAFRNLVDPAEDDYLRRRLSPAAFREVQRKRLRAAADYIRVAAHNAAVLVMIGQAAVTASDAATAQAAHQLVEDGLLLRRNATLALMKIYIALAWPSSALAAAPVLHGYERLSGSAMLLGRLQNPAVPVRISMVL
jgi:hypothetical protein